MSSMITTGYYINAFKVGNIELIGADRYLYDIYIILKEPNDEPTPEEVSKIEEAIDKMDPSTVRTNAAKVIELLDLNCTKYGFEVI